MDEEKYTTLTLIKRNERVAMLTPGKTDFKARMVPHTSN
jgi:hypothetical protein